MKRPVEPRKPYPPYKPTAPTKRIVQARTLGKTEVDRYGSYSFETFHQMMMAACKDSDIESIEQEKIQFSIEVDNEHSYYDEVIPHVNMTIYVNEEIDNPHFDALKKHHEKNLKKYEAENDKYKADMKQYKIDLAKYEEEYPIYMLEFHKKQAAALEKSVIDRASKSKKGKV